MLNFGIFHQKSKIKHLFLKIKKYKVIICQYDVFLYVEQGWLRHKDRISWQNFENYKNFNNFINKIMRIAIILEILPINSIFML